jgi:hypothetical protein
MTGTHQPRVWVPALGAVIALPFMFGVVCSPTFFTAMLCLVGEYLAAECWFGPTLAFLQNALPSSVHGLATACFLFVGTMIGNISPAVLGAVDDRLNNKDDLRWWLLGVVGVSYVGCALLFAVAGCLLGRKGKGPTTTEKMEA